MGLYDKIHIINAIILILTIVSLVGLGSTIGDIYEYGRVELSLKDMIFYKSWLKQQDPKTVNDEMIKLGKVLFYIKILTFTYIFSLVGIIILTVLIVFKGTNISKDFILLTDLMVILLFILEPISNFCEMKIKEKIDSSIKFILYDFIKVGIINIVSFMLLIITMLIMTPLTEKIILRLLNIVNINISLIGYIVSICVYQYFVINIMLKILKFLLKTTKRFNEKYLNKKVIKTQTYFYLIIIYLLYKMFIFNDYLGTVIETIFAIPIEAITIFFMIDVYIDKKKK